MSKLKLWSEHPSWEGAEKEWDEGAEKAKCARPIKGLKTLPLMPGITDETTKHLKWKALKWMIAKDKDRKILKNFLKDPIKYGIGYLKSIMKKKPYSREGDFFLYNVDSISDFRSLMKDPKSVLIIGFSYCHKPFECPSGRFSPNCMHDSENPICRQCFIGKAIHAMPEERVVPLIIPTIHYIGEKVFEYVHQNPNKKILFIITACEMTLEMFGDWGNMVGICGLGVRLDGRICNTMKAFELSEEGVKPGLTVVLDDTQKEILELIRQLRS